MIQLRDIRICLQGIVPSSIATCAADGTPNISYISHVHFVDDQHVAISFQFFNATRRNVQENPNVMLRVADPRNMQHYLIKARYERSEFEGPLYDHMSQRLQVIAPYEGMSDVFALRAADVYRVIEIEKEPDFTSLDLALPPAESLAGGPGAADLEALRVVVDRLAHACSLEEAIDRALLLLDRFFGFRHLILMLADARERILTTHASRGYAEAGVGSEVEIGKGLVGMVAKLRKPLRLTGVDASLRYARTMREEARASGLVDRCDEIPLPGLKAPFDQLGLPLVAGRRLHGVLIAETAAAVEIGTREQNLLSVVAAQLAGAIARFDAALAEETECAEPAVGLPAPQPTSAKGPARRFVFVKSDDSIFVEDVYLIRNVPARILWYLLKAHRDHQRVEFTNRELRLEPWFQLPDLKDNLESRLILLKKRLEEKRPGVLIKSTGRGRFALELSSRLDLTER